MSKLLSVENAHISYGKVEALKGEPMLVVREVDIKA